MSIRSGASHWKAHWEHEAYRVPVVHPKIDDALMRALHPVRDKRILEVGVGMGGDSLALARAGAEVWALDYVEVALRSVTSFAARECVGVRTVQGDALALPFADGTFDAVFHQGLLEHFRDGDQLRILRENWRVLKDGGIVLIDVPQKYSAYTRYKRRLIRRGQWFAGWETEFSAPALTRLVRRAGFEVRSMYPRDYFGILARLRVMFVQEPARGRGRYVPPFLRASYQGVWRLIERSPLALYLCWCVGLVAAKPPQQPRRI